MSERYRAAVAQFVDGFAEEETQEEAMRCIRGLIEKIVVRRMLKVMTSTSTYTAHWRRF